MVDSQPDVTVFERALAMEMRSVKLQDVRNPFAACRVYGSADVQKAHRRAAIAISLRHSGHFFVVGSGGASPRFRRALIALTGTTMAKYTAAPISTNEMTALRKSPIRNSLPLILRTRAEKSGLPKRAPMSGVSRSFTR